MRKLYSAIFLLLFVTTAISGCVLELHDPFDGEYHGGYEGHGHDD